jgi:hypothetical protein
MSKWEVIASTHEKPPMQAECVISRRICVCDDESDANMIREAKEYYQRHMFPRSDGDTMWVTYSVQAID